MRQEIEVERSRQYPLGRGPDELDTPKVDPSNPLGRDVAEIERMYYEQRVG